MPTLPSVNGASTFCIGKDPATDEPAVIAVSADTGAIQVEVISDGGATTVAAAFSEYMETTSSLSAGATFIGSSHDRGAAPTKCRVSAFAASAQTGKLEIQQAPDNSTWVTTAIATHAAGASCQITDHPLVQRYWRIKYTNTDSNPANSLAVGSHSYSV